MRTFVLCSLACLLPACAEDQPTGQTTRDLLVELAESAPELTLTASTDFAGSQATVTYPAHGQVMTAPLAGHAEADFTLEGDGFVLTRFDVDLEDFTVAGLDPGVDTPVDISGATLRLAAHAPTAEVHVDADGRAWVSPTFTGSAHFSAEGLGELDYERTEAVVEPITAVFTVAADGATVTIDYDYPLAPPGSAPVTLHVRYTAAIPAP
jgi:hypothetical protein